MEKVRTFMKKTLVMFVLLGMLSGCSREEVSQPAYTKQDTDREPAIFLRTATIMPDGSSVVNSLYALQSLMEQESAGQMLVEVFGNGVLFNDSKEELEALQRGDIALMSCETSYLVDYIPNAALFDYPYLFSSVGEAQRFLEENPEIFEELAGKAFHNDMVLLALIPTGMRSVAAQDASFLNAGDNKTEVRIASMATELDLQMWDSIGLAAVPVSPNNYVRSVGDKMLNAAEGSLSLLYDCSMFQEGDRIYRTGHTISVQAVLFSRKIYDEILDEKQRRQLKKAVEEFVRTETIELQQAEEFSFNKFGKNGIQVMDLLPEEKEELERRMEAVVPAVTEKLEEEFKHYAEDLTSG